MKSGILKIILFFCIVLCTSVSFAESMEEYVKTIKSTFGDNDLGKFIKTYGKPDNDDSTAYDKPRPPIVTRSITYYKADVKVISVVDAKMDQPPPYKRWKIIGFTDSNSRTKLSADETKKRLSIQLHNTIKK